MIDGTRSAQSLAITPAALAQLEAIREQWLRPLINQIREQAEQLGRLEAERAALCRERDQLTTRVTDERALADQLVDVLERERDTRRWERDQIAEQRPTERVTWQQLIEVTGERDRLRSELERARAHEPAPETSSPPPAPGMTVGKTWWRRLRRRRMGGS